MRHALAIGGLIFIGIIVIPGLWLAHKSKAALEPGILSAQVEKLDLRGEAQNAPASGRVVNFIISDARDASGAGDGQEERSSAYTSEDMEVLSSVQKPSFVSRLAVWFRRTFLRRNMSAGDGSALVRTLSNTPGAAVWVHRGEETASESEMLRELKRAMIKAFDCGARINIITEGPAAAAVLKAVKMLKEEKRPYGRSPVVSRIIAVNMNRATLKGMDHDLFSDYGYTDLAEEMVFVWNPPLDPKKTTIELFSPKYNGKRFNGTELCAMMGGGGTEVEKTLRLIEEMGRDIYSAEAVVGSLAAKAEEKKLADKAKAEAVPPERWTAKPVSRDLMGRTYDRSKPAEEAAVPARPADSLSAISGGWVKEETAEETGRVAQKANRPAQDRVRPSDRTKGKAANCKVGEGELFPICSWYDAMAYCAGRLPSVPQLQTWFRADCTGGKRSGSCGHWFWSAESSGTSDARGMGFFNEGYVEKAGKASVTTPTLQYTYVRCVK